MKCPIARYECRRVEVKLTDGPVAAFQCIEQGGVRYMLLTPDAWARFEADWALARAIIAAQRGDSEMGGEGR